MENIVEKYGVDALAASRNADALSKEIPLLRYAHNNNPTEENLKALTEAKDRAVELHLKAASIWPILDAHCRSRRAHHAKQAALHSEP